MSSVQKNKQKSFHQVSNGSIITEPGGDRLTSVTEWSYDFTVFIPTFNRAHVLPRTLESVAQQTYRSFETLIIDDGTTDGTDDLVRS